MITIFLPEVDRAEKKKIEFNMPFFTFFFSILNVFNTSLLTKAKEVKSFLRMIEFSRTKS